MIIRCERCSTTYELDEALLAPEGSPVQCTKCQHVFTALPPRAAGRTLVGVPAAPPPQPVEPARPAAPAAPASRQGPSIYRPTPGSGSPASVRPPRPRRDTMGAFEARLKASARLKWLVPVAAAAVAAIAVAGWLILRDRVDPSALRRHAEAMALVALDDVASLERANQALEQLSREGAGIRTLEADRALAQSLLAAGLSEEVAPEVARLAARAAERDRLAATLPPPEALAALTVEIESLRVQVEPRQARARALASEAWATLRRQGPDERGEQAVARALAVHFASTGDRDQALRFIRGAGAAADRDPWISLAEAWLDAREESREARERAVTKLTALARAHPELIRARFLLARTQAALGLREQAAATLDGLLAANPDHRRARRLREELVAPATAAPAAVAPPPAPRPAPRAAQPGAAAGVAPGGGSPTAAARVSPPPPASQPADGGEGGKAPAAPPPIQMPNPDSAPVHE